VSQNNDRLKPTSKVLNARRLIVTVSQDDIRLKPTIKVLNVKTDCDCTTRQQQTETEEQGAKCKKTKRDCMRRKREEIGHRSQNDIRSTKQDDIYGT
jgi:hypothetical protein